MKNNNRKLFSLGLISLLSGCFSDSNQSNSDVQTSNSNFNPNNSEATEPGGYMYFFEEGIPKTIHSKNKISITNQHYKDGSHSLQWQLDTKNQLTFTQPITFEPQDSNEAAPYTFIAWVYNDEPLEASATFQFGTDNRIDAQFTYSLNFQGWRGISVPYRDMDGKAVSGMNKLSIIVPDDITGRLIFDQIMMSVPVDNRWPTPDYQQPYVNPDVTKMASKNWTALLMYDNMLKEEYPSFNFEHEFNDSSGDSANIYKNFDQYLGVKTDKVISQQAIQDNLDQYLPFKIAFNADGSVYGQPLDHPKRQNVLKTGIVTDTTLAMLTDTMGIRTLGKTLLETARYLRSQSLAPSDRQLLETAFLEATRYALDQGWQGGSGFQVITHVGYQTREYFDAFFVARQLLADNQLLKPVQQSMMWFNATGRIFEQDSEITSSNVDILNTQLQWMIKSILLLPDQSERDDMLAKLQSWLSKTLLASDGVGGGFKPDGSVFHHSQHYPAYGKDAFSGLSGAIYGLSHSPYQISTAAHQRINDVLLKMRIYTKETNTPIVLSGRHPDGKQKISAQPFKWLALAGDPNGSSKIDSELAAAYANLTKKDEFEGIPAEAEPIGVWSMNYASMLVARGQSPTYDKKSWLAIARGFSRYLVGNETYQTDNLYGRYLQYGQLEIMPSDVSLRAFSHDGWDWNRYPGTTTIHRTNEDLRATLSQLPDAGIEEMLLSTESYSGANTLHNNGMFAMRLHGHSKYDQQSLYANKSYFVFGNTIVALGSDIQNSDSQHNTETTLFQYSTPHLEPVYVNGSPVNTVDTVETFKTDVTFLDPAGNRYFVKNTDGEETQFLYQKQFSNAEKDGSPTSGIFATALINHGKAPTDSGYEYAIKVEGQDNSSPVYTVLQKDHNVHAVIGEDKTEAYAFFAPASIESPSYLLSSATASQIMLKPDSSGKQLELSVVNPDLSLYTGTDPDQVDSNGQQIEVSIYSRPWRFHPSQSAPNILTLKGEWSLSQDSPNSSNDIVINIVNGHTVISIPTINATPEKLILHAM